MIIRITESLDVNPKSLMSAVVDTVNIWWANCPHPYNMGTLSAVQNNL